MDLNTSSGSSWTSVPHTASQNSSSIWIMTIFTVEGNTALSYYKYNFGFLPHYYCHYCFLHITSAGHMNVLPHPCTSVFLCLHLNIHTAGRLQFMPINLALWDHSSMLECESKHLPVNSGGGSSIGVLLYYEGQILLYQSKQSTWEPGDLEAMV